MGPAILNLVVDPDCSLQNMNRVSAVVCDTFFRHGAEICSLLRATARALDPQSLAHQLDGRQLISIPNNSTILVVIIVVDIVAIITTFTHYT